MMKVASASVLEHRGLARIAIVERHIRLENQRDLEGVLRTLGDSAQYDDEPWANIIKAGAESAGFTSSS